MSLNNLSIRLQVLIPLLLASLLCGALNAHPKARFYKGAAEFTQAFMSVESQGFDMLA